MQLKFSFQISLDISDILNEIEIFGIAVRSFWIPGFYSIARVILLIS